MCRALMGKNSYCTFSNFIGSHFPTCIIYCIVGIECVSGVLFTTNALVNGVELKWINPFITNSLFIMIISYNVFSDGNVL